MRARRAADVAIDPRVDGSPWDAGLRAVGRRMSAGEPIIGDVADLPAGGAAGVPALRGSRRSPTTRSPSTASGGAASGSRTATDRATGSLTDLDGVRTAAALLGAAIARQRQEERLRDAETRYRSVVERIPAVTYVDVSRSPTACGWRSSARRSRRCSGYPHERVPRRSPTSGSTWCTPTTALASRRRPAAPATRGLPFDEEYRMRHADGHWVWVHDTSTPVPDRAATDATLLPGVPRRHHRTQGGRGGARTRPSPGTGRWSRRSRR